MRNHKNALALLVALTLLPLAPSARAQAPEDPATTALARDLFRQALEAGAQGRWPEAVERYRRVLELRDTPRVEFNLAQALLESGELVEASELFVRLRRSEATPAVVREALEPLLERARRATAHVTLEVRGDSAGVSLELDGRPLPAVTWGVAMPVDPGAHRVRALRAGEPVTVVEAQLQPGEERALELVLPEVHVVTPADAAALRARPEDEVEATPRRGGVLRSPWFWTVLGVVLAGAVVSAVVVRSDSSAPTLEGSFMPGRIEL
ncbi:MAG: hypothetical protein GXP55_13320 [Deltaproteobacteria bacterium]|nr:hypothetical protein [Deltaproteobacteria bacterium]